MAAGKKTCEVQSFWEFFRAAAEVTEDSYDVVSFDDNAQTASELANLVLSGKKRATAGLLHQFVVGLEPLPVIGGYVVLIDGAGTPCAVWRTIELRLGPLSSVDEAFASDEGEGDGSRAFWLRVHREFFGRYAMSNGIAFDDDAETVFERFEVLWPPNLTNSSS